MPGSLFEYRGGHVAEGLLTVIVTNDHLPGETDVDLQALLMDVDVGVPTRIEASMPDADRAVSTIGPTDEEVVHHPFMTCREILIEILESNEPHPGLSPVSQRTGLTVSINST